MPETASRRKIKKTLSTPALWALVVLIVVITNVSSGMFCWRQAAKTAEKRAAAEMQTYIAEHGVDRSLTYQRLTDSWTKR